MRLLLANRSNDRLVILTELLVLYAIAKLSYALFNLGPRFRSLAAIRRRQISAIPTIILLQVAAVSLIMTSTGPNFLSGFLNPATRDDIFNIWFLITIGYVFEILYRPLHPFLAAHHLFVQIFSYYFLLYLEDLPHVVLYARLFLILIIWGLGVMDTLVELTIVVYYTTPVDKRWSRKLVRTLEKLSEAARLVLWALLFGYILTHFGEFRERLSSAEKVFWIVALGLWTYIEVDDAKVLWHMAEKFGKTNGKGNSEPVK